MKLSVILPAYKEPYLQKTIDSLLGNSELGDQIEVLPVWDSPEHAFPLTADPRVKVITLRQRWGMRACINAGISEAKGEFIIKTDAHCVYQIGFDRAMVESYKEPNWLVIPSRFRVDEEKWEMKNKGRYLGVNYHYLYYDAPNSNGDLGMGALVLSKESPDRIDDTMTFQGSCWMADRKYFLEKVGWLDDRTETYGSFAGEYIEVGLKYWLNGGEIKVNKDIHYGHLSKCKHHYNNRVFCKSLKNNWKNQQQLTWIARHWRNDEEPGMKYPFAWLIEKFQPLPGWPRDKHLWRVPA